MIQSVTLPVIVPLRKIQSELQPLTEDWQPHFNTKQYEGGWTVLPLRSPGGLADLIIPDAREEQHFADTALMERCPAIRALLESLQCPIMAVRLMNLKAGAIINEHRDHDLAFEKGEARLHIPVFTNAAVRFTVNGTDIPMREGECWYVNVNLPHKVANGGTSDRIHLVVDCVVNDWLKDLFAKGEIVLAPAAPQSENLQKIIAELRRQNTETSNRLVKELEQQLARSLQ